MTPAKELFVANGMNPEDKRASHSPTGLASQLLHLQGFPAGSKGRIHLLMQETRVWSLGWEDPLEEEMATHSSILAWEIPGTEEPGGPQSIGSHRARHN